MAVMTAYPQAMPKANENRIVRKTVEEARNVFIA
jgi:hypothetical protein